MLEDHLVLHCSALKRRRRRSSIQLAREWKLSIGLSQINVRLGGRRLCNFSGHISESTSASGMVDADEVTVMLPEDKIQVINLSSYTYV